MTVEHPVRRFLARFCSADTMADVVDPTLADMRFERGRRAWLGYLSLARALAMHVIVSTPSMLTRVYVDDERAVPRVAFATLATSLAVALPLVLIPMLGFLRSSLGGGTSGVAPRSAQSLAMVVLLLPQALVVTLPAALLVACPLALKRRHLTARLRRRVMALAVVVCLAMGVLVNWGAPLAHPGFRAIINGTPRVQGVARETMFTGFRHALASLERNKALSPESVARVRSGLEYRYQFRLALIASPIPLGLVAVALTATAAGRQRPVMLGLVASVGYILAVFRLDADASRFVPFVPTVAAGLMAWLPLLLLTAVALGRWRAQAISA